MKPEYIIGDIVMYDNKIMVVKEPRDEIHFDLSCPKEGLTYCFVNVNEIKPVDLTSAILEKNGWVWSDEHEELTFGTAPIAIYPESDYFMVDTFRIKLRYVHQLQHLLFGLNINSEMEV